MTRIPDQNRYGAQADQVRAQQVVPVGPPPSPQVPLPPQAGAVAAAPTGTTPIPLDAPTMRPNEPVTAGAPSGPGPGPPPPLQPNTVGDLLAAITPTSPELAELYDYLVSGGQ